jgi:hypothetical protein
LGRGTYLDGGVPVTLWRRIQAVALWLPHGATVSGRTAAHVWGVDLADDGDPIELTSATRLRARPGLLVRTSVIRPDEVTEHRGIPLTTPLHTAWEIAQTLPEMDAIGWVDALARRRRLTRSDLVRHAHTHRGEHGSRRATSTLELADPRAESPPESKLRISLVRAGLPVPIPQFIVLHGGFFVARVDLAWPACRLAIEYDGQWHADSGQLHRDRSRLRDLNAAGWYVYPVTREDMRDLPRLVRQIAELLDQRSTVV